MQSMYRKILLTGAGPRGFVGKNLAEALKDKYELFTPPSQQLDLRDYDATAKYIDSNKIDTIIHACSSPVNKLCSDLRMYFNLERISRNLHRLICFGSGAEYDKRFDIVMASEDDIGKRIPIDEYGLAKYIITNHAVNAKNVYILRLFGIFGKYEDWTFKFISNICCKAMYDLPITIRRECKFDYIFIDDLPQIVEWIIDKTPKHKDYNFVYGTPVCLTELAAIVLKISGKSLDVTILNPKGKSNEYTAKNKRLAKELGFFDPTKLETAVNKMYEYYCSIKEHIPYDVLKGTR